MSEQAPPIDWREQIVRPTIQNATPYCDVFLQMLLEGMEGLGPDAYIMLAKTNRRFADWCHQNAAILDAEHGMQKAFGKGSGNA